MFWIRLIARVVLLLVRFLDACLGGLFLFEGCLVPVSYVVGIMFCFSCARHVGLFDRYTGRFASCPICWDWL